MNVIAPSDSASSPPPRKLRTFLSAARWLVQVLCALFMVLVGLEFVDFYRHALAGAAAAAHRPAAVEALLPLSALLAFKRFVLTGAWDELHPAGLVILLAVIVSAVVARKAFCGWICPVGTLSRVLEWLGGRWHLLRRRDANAPRTWLDRVAYVPKYLVLSLFFWAIFVMMDLPSITEFLASPYNRVADLHLLLFFAHPSTTAIVVIGAFAVGSLFVKHLWCRFFCPYGAFLGLASRLSPQRVVRDPDTCIGCERCTRGCPTGIVVHTQLRVLTPECTGCMDCVAVCPVDDCLTIGRRARKGWSPVWVPALAVVVLFAAWFAASATGHWTSRATAAQFGAWYREAAEADAPAPPPSGP